MIILPASGRREERPRSAAAGVARGGVGMHVCSSGLKVVRHVGVGFCRVEEPDWFHVAAANAGVLSGEAGHITDELQLAKQGL